jgi:hypothetical protein
VEITCKSENKSVLVLKTVIDVRSSKRPLLVPEIGLSNEGGITVMSVEPEVNRWSGVNESITLPSKTLPSAIVELLNEGQITLKSVETGVE